MAGPTLRAATVALLRRVPYFARLPTAELTQLARLCASRRLDPGQTIFEEGQPCRGLYIVADGHVEVRQVSLRGREQVFHTEGPGATLGEAPLFDCGGYIATAVAVEAATVVFLPRTEVIDLCRRRPVVALAMLETMARRLRRFAGIVSDLAFHPVTERLARHLEAAAAGPVTAGAHIDVRLTQTQLAARLGTVRELVARAFAQLEANGVITRNRTHVVVRDPARLIALARGDGAATRDV